MFFDYQKPLKNLGLSQKIIDRLVKSVQSEFPHDEMMCELHLVRLANALKEKFLTVKEALQENEPHRAAS